MDDGTMGFSDETPSKGVLRLEFASIFFLIPMALAVPILPIYLKLAMVAIGLLYLIVVTRNKGYLSLTSFLPDQPIPKMVWLRWCVFVVGSTIAVYLLYPELLFKVVINDPLLFVFILFVYTFLSVLPQEWLYRHFYFQRYVSILPVGVAGILLNAFLFCWVHIMFYNWLVMALTFVGGVLFYRTYRQTSSLYVVSVEHTLYGLWLFTLGIGDMLAFPG